MVAPSSQVRVIGQLLLVFLLLFLPGLAESAPETPPTAGEFCGSAGPPAESLSCPKTMGPRCYCSMSAKKMAPGTDFCFARNHQRTAPPKVRRPDGKPRVLPPLTVGLPTLEVYPGVPKPPPRA